MESFMCILMNTEYLNKTLFRTNNIDKNSTILKAVNILENFEKYKTIDDIKKENNEHINKAIEEFENNPLLLIQWEEIQKEYNK